MFTSPLVAFLLKSGGACQFEDPKIVRSSASTLIQRKVPLVPHGAPRGHAYARASDSAVASSVAISQAYEDLSHLKPNA